MEEVDPHEKGKRFERRVLRDYKEKYPDKTVLWREDFAGRKTGETFEVDVAVVHPDSGQLEIAVQCKAHKQKVTRDHIAKWVGKARDDLEAEPHYAALGFNQGARNFARGLNVELLTPHELDDDRARIAPSSNLHDCFQQYDSLDTAYDRAIFCLQVILETGILDEANQVRDSRASTAEVKFYSGNANRRFTLYRDPDTQFGTKILYAINKVDGETNHGQHITWRAFGRPDGNLIPRGVGGVAGDRALPIPPEVEDARDDIEDVLAKANRAFDLASPEWNDEARFRVFLEAWRHLAKTPINPLDSALSHTPTPFWANQSTYRDKEYLSKLKHAVFQIDAGSRNGPGPRVIEMDQFWETYLNGLKGESIEDLNSLFRTDLTEYVPGKVLPVFCNGSNENAPMLQTFHRASVINQAYQERETRIENLLERIAQSE